MIDAPFRVHIVGGGLAGVEAAFQCTKRGIAVTLHEMRPDRNTAAHATGNLAELVCSNSFKSTSDGTAPGLLKKEMLLLDSVIVRSAFQASVPAGQALAVDREQFSKIIENTLSAFPHFELKRGEVCDLPTEAEAIARSEYWIVASGPLSSPSIAGALQRYLGKDDRLFFYDAIAPIIDADTIDFSQGFWANRWGDQEEEGDYFNLPLDKAQYEQFIAAIKVAEKMELHEFEEVRYFESCLPIEVMVERGDETLRFGPLKPTGFKDPRTGRRPWAVVQLRRENASGSMLSMVGFQTKMKWPEQKRVFAMLPGLGHAEFFRMGSVHRNTYLECPKLLADDLSVKGHSRLFLAGQITGVEGYTESSAIGLVVGRQVADLILKRPLLKIPEGTMLGALVGYIQHGLKSHYQPMNANWGLLPPLPKVKGVTKSDRKVAKSQLAIESLTHWKAIYDGYAP